MNDNINRNAIRHGHIQDFGPSKGTNFTQHFGNEGNRTSLRDLKQIITGHLNGRIEN